LVRRVLKGVYVASQVEDSQVVRAQALSLIVPEASVITDWTACWLYTGLLPPGDHLRIPPLSVFRLPGHARLRNQLVLSGERSLRSVDLDTVDGIAATTPLRTAWDLGRFASRDNAIVALDGLLRHGTFTQDVLVGDVERFRRQRGVVQLRALAPLADGRAESPGESVLRLRWLDCTSLPSPTPQVRVLSNAGAEIYRIDLAVEEIRFGVEYDGELWHSTDEAITHDAQRREWLRRERGWAIEAVRKANLFGATRDIEGILYEGMASARTGVFRDAG
jgi:hypothetical protein